MDVLEVIRLILLVAHFIGLAGIIGSFLLQSKTKTGLDLRGMLIGVSVQLVSGALLIGVRQAADLDVDNIKMAFKLAIAIAVLVAVLIARSRQKKAVAAGTSEKSVLPWFHTAGALAIVNVIIAVVWI